MKEIEIIKEIKEKFDKASPYPDHNLSVRKDWVLGFFDNLIKEKQRKHLKK